MPNEIRIATWRDAAPSARQTLSELLYNYRGVIAVICCLPVCALFLNFFPSFATFAWVFVGTAIFAVVFVLLLSAASRYYGYYTTPMPVVHHGDALPRMNAVLRFDVEGHVYGEDRGELAIIDDWLVFEGERTGFSVCPDDIRDYLRLPSEGGLPQLSLGLKDTYAHVRIRILAEPTYRDPAAFLESWARRMVQAPRITVLPPMELMPGYRRGSLHFVADSGSSRFAQGFGAFLAVSLSIFISAAIQSIGALFFLLGLYIFFQFALRRSAAVSGQRALQALALTREALSANPVSEGLPPIPPVRAMQEKARSQSVIR